MVRDEESHADWFETQVAAVERLRRRAVPRAVRRPGPLAGLTCGVSSPRAEERSGRPRSVNEWCSWATRPPAVLLGAARRSAAAACPARRQARPACRSAGARRRRPPRRRPRRPARRCSNEPLRPATRRTAARCPGRPRCPGHRPPGAGRRTSRCHRRGRRAPWRGRPRAPPSPSAAQLVDLLVICLRVVRHARADHRGALDSSRCTTPRSAQTCRRASFVASLTSGVTATGSSSPGGPTHTRNSNGFLISPLMCASQRAA